MPLVVCTIFFFLLFSCEYIWHLVCLSEEEHALERYHAFEHPRRLTSDRYLDSLG